MNRKLHNTLIAIIASSSLLTLGLVAGTPVMPSPLSISGPAVMVKADQRPASADAAPRQAKAASALPRGHTPAVRRTRHSVSMPFFSFVPRG